MNYCGHCGSPLDPDGRCPTCSATDAGSVPRIVEQTAQTLPPPSAAPPPPPPVDPSATVVLPKGTIAPAPTGTAGTVAARTAAAAGATRASATADQPTQIVTRLDPLPGQWDDGREDVYAPVGEDPQSWRRSQLATVGVIAAILLLAGLGVVLWNLLADDPDSLGTAVPDVSTTCARSRASACRRRRRCRRRERPHPARCRARSR